VKKWSKVTIEEAEKMGIKLKKDEFCLNSLLIQNGIKKNG
jgi:hypothetical protein